MSTSICVTLSIILCFLMGILHDAYVEELKDGTHLLTQKEIPKTGDQPTHTFVLPAQITLCELNEEGEMVRGETFRTHSCAEYRKAIKTYTVDNKGYRFAGLAWLCWLMDPCSKGGAP